MRKKFRQIRKRFAIVRRRHVRRLRLLSRHPMVVLVATFLVLAGLSAAGFVFIGGSKKVIAADSLIVIVSHDGVQQVVPTREPTVGALLQRLNIKLNQGDVVEPSTGTPINQDEFRINVYRAVPVEVVDGARKTFTFSAATTPRSIAAQAGVKVYPEDYVNIVPTTNFLAEDAIGERVVINPATPVHVNLYGTPVVLRTHAKTVGALLKSRGITLAKNDSVEPAAITPIAANQQIFILRKGTKLESDTETIAIPVQNINDASLSVGTSAVRQAGSPGRKIVTYEDELINGKVAHRKVIQTVVVVPPVTEIVAVGTARLSTDLQQWLQELRDCESGGNYQAVSVPYDSAGDRYRGAYQFSQTTWDSLSTGYAYANQAPPNVQDQAIIRNTLETSGLVTQNPLCYQTTGISNYPPE